MSVHKIIDNTTLKVALKLKKQKTNFQEYINPINVHVKRQEQNRTAHDTITIKGKHKGYFTGV